MRRLDDAISVLHEGEEFFYRANSYNRRALSAIKTKLGLAYLFTDKTDLAAPWIESVFNEEPDNPEAIRAYAALTIKRDDITEAERALARLREAKIKNRFDKCNFHLLYGLFYLGIGQPQKASQEFSKAHSHDRANVFVMMKWARTLYEIGRSLWLDSSKGYEVYLRDCAGLVKMILEFDKDNAEGVSLMHSLHQDFGIDL